VLLVKQSIENIEDALEAWDWIDFSGKQPFITTCFGDVFFESEDGIFFLDSIGGTLERVADTNEDLQGKNKGQPKVFKANKSRHNLIR
jgi:hypothetical protein